MSQYIQNFLEDCTEEYQKFSTVESFNLQAPCVLYIGQAFRCSSENAFYIFNQQIYSII